MGAARLSSSAPAAILAGFHRSLMRMPSPDSIDLLSPFLVPPSDARHRLFHGRGHQGRLMPVRAVQRVHVGGVERERASSAATTGAARSSRPARSPWPPEAARPSGRFGDPSCWRSSVVPWGLRAPGKVKVLVRVPGVGPARGPADDGPDPAIDPWQGLLVLRHGRRLHSPRCHSLPGAAQRLRRLD